MNNAASLFPSGRARKVGAGCGKPGAVLVTISIVTALLALFIVCGIGGPQAFWLAVACFILLGLVLSIWEWMKGCMKAGADIDDTPRPPKPPRKKFKPAALPNNVIRFPGKRQIRQD